MKQKLTNLAQRLVSVLFMQKKSEKKRLRGLKLRADELADKIEESKALKKLT